MWENVVWPILGWYLVVQLCGLAAWPLARLAFSALPDRGYAFSKMLGILLVGYLLWMGTALGWLRNETGGAWLALTGVALASLAASRFRFHFRDAIRDTRHFGVVEMLFALGLAGWAFVRMHDPAANHTEQPMDLMFMNSIWVSATFPPQDAWFAGYAISYYYFGYWLLTTVGRLAGTPPEIAYNVGQAAWFGLLLVGAYGAGYNLSAFVLPGSTTAAEPGSEPSGESNSPGRSSSMQPISAQWTGRVGGLLAAAGVAMAGNLQSVLEWLYAMGAPVARLAEAVDVYNFPANASVTGAWYVDMGWWWWRTSRVIYDRNLAGGHIEIIDEFPMFSYVLGDNHPHVLAMPVVILVIGLAMNVLFGAYLRRAIARDKASARAESSETADSAGEMGHAVGGVPARANVDSAPWVDVVGGWGQLCLMVLTGGSLIFLNTWDFPPYWGLLLLCFLAAWRVIGRQVGQGSVSAVIFGATLLAGALAFYFPYLLTAQSQAGGLIPNLFYPTRLSQFVMMFGSWLPATALLLWIATRWGRPGLKVLAGGGLVALGLPILFLVLTGLAALNTGGGQAMLAQMALPPDGPGYGSIMVSRRLAQGFMLLLVGGTLAWTLALLWRWYVADGPRNRSGARHVYDATHARMGFALLLLLCGLILVYLPEFVFLRDQFGNRMNTIFKFYYQAWLLFGLAAAFIVAEQWRGDGRGNPYSGGLIARAVSGIALGVLVLCLIFPFAASYSKAGGFRVNARTLDATAYLQGFAPDIFEAMAWIRQNIPGDAIVLEGEGQSYSAEHNRVSTMTGRPTLLGWPGHQRQWRGEAYGRMDGGRGSAINAIYRSRDPVELRALLDYWQIDYVYVSPVERREYEMSDVNERVMEVVGVKVFDRENVRIFRVNRVTDASRGMGTP